MRTSVHDSEQDRKERITRNCRKMLKLAVAADEAAQELWDFVAIFGNTYECEESLKIARRKMGVQACTDRAVDKLSRVSYKLGREG